MNANPSNCHQAYHTHGFPHRACGILFEDGVANVVDSKITATDDSTYIDNRTDDLKRLLLDREEGLRLHYTERRALSCGNVKVYFEFKAPDDESAKATASGVSSFLNEVCSREQSPFFLYGINQETYLLIFYECLVPFSKLQAIYTPIQKRFTQISDIKHESFVADFQPYGTAKINGCNSCGGRFPIFLNCKACSGIGYVTTRPILSTIYHWSGEDTVEEYKLDSIAKIRSFIACSTMTHCSNTHVKLQQTIDVKIRRMNEEHLFLNFELQDLLENIMSKISPVYTDFAIAKLYHKRPIATKRSNTKRSSKTNKLELVFVPERKAVCNPKRSAALRTEHTVYFQLQFDKIDYKIKAVCKECRRTSEIKSCSKFDMRDISKLCKST